MVAGGEHTAPVVLLRQGTRYKALQTRTEVGNMPGAAPLANGRRSGVEDKLPWRPAASYGQLALRGGEGKREDVQLDRELTSNVLEGMARAEEAERRGVGAQKVAAGGGEDADGGGDCGYPAMIPSA